MNAGDGSNDYKDNIVMGGFLEMRREPLIPFTGVLRISKLLSTLMLFDFHIYIRF